MNAIKMVKLALISLKLLCYQCRRLLKNLVKISAKQLVTHIMMKLKNLLQENMKKRKNMTIVIIKMLLIWPTIIIKTEV